MNFTLYDQCLYQAEGVPPGTRGYGGACDQFGRYCHVWECVDYFQLPMLPAADPWVKAFLAAQQDAASTADDPGTDSTGGTGGIGGTDADGGDADGSNSGPVWAVKWSDQVRGRSPWSSDWYALGCTALDLAAAARQDGRDAFTATIGCAPFQPKAGEQA